MTITQRRFFNASIEDLEPLRAIVFWHERLPHLRVTIPEETLSLKLRKTAITP